MNWIKLIRISKQISDHKTDYFPLYRFTFSLFLGGHPILALQGWHSLLQPTSWLLVGCIPLLVGDTPLGSQIHLNFGWLNAKFFSSSQKPVFVGFSSSLIVVQVSISKIVGYFNVYLNISNSQIFRVSKPLLILSSFPSRCRKRAPLNPYTGVLFSQPPLLTGA